jgi:hypothetical protein
MFTDLSAGGTSRATHARTSPLSNRKLRQPLEWGFWSSSKLRLAYGMGEFHHAYTENIVMFTRFKECQCFNNNRDSLPVNHALK